MLTICFGVGRQRQRLQKRPWHRWIAGVALSEDHAAAQAGGLAPENSLCTL